MYLVDDIGQITESLLSLCVRDPEAPYYTESGLIRRIEYERRRQPQLRSSHRQDALGYLLEREWTGIVQLARLTRRQREVFEKRLSGWTFEEIGGQNGRTRQSAQRVFTQAVRKLIRAWSEYPFRGLSDVYRQETGRGGGTLRG
jgi:hypothetical protein